MYYVYILRSKNDERTYVGYTSDIKRRLREHKQGKVESTRHRRPLELFHLEEFVSKREAKKREQWYKSSSGRNRMKELFKEKDMSDSDPCALSEARKYSWNATII